MVAILMSFDGRDYLGRFPPSELSLHWYERFFSSTYYLKGLAISLALAVMATVVSVIVGATCAFVLDRYQGAGKEALSIFFLSPLVISHVIIGFSLLIFLSTIGVFDGMVRLIAGHIIVTLPYTIRTTLASLVGIKRSLTEAALSLGATEPRAFWRITFPLAKTGIAAGAIFAFAFSMDEVSASLFLSDPDSYTLPVAMVSMMRSQFDLSIAVAAVVLMVMTVILILVLDRVVGLDKVIGQGIYRS